MYYTLVVAKLKPKYRGPGVTLMNNYSLSGKCIYVYTGAYLYTMYSDPHHAPSIV